MVIIDTKFYAGELYLMLENGDIIHVITRGSYNPWEMVIRKDDG